METKFILAAALILAAIIIGRWFIGRGLLICLVFFVSSAALMAQAGGSAQAPDPNNPLAPLAGFLGSALVTKILVWMGAARAIGKLVSSKLLEIQDKLIVYIVGSDSTDDDHWLLGIIGNPIYIGGSAAIDYFFSVKLRQRDHLMTIFAGLKPAPGTEPATPK